MKLIFTFLIALISFILNAQEPCFQILSEAIGVNLTTEQINEFEQASCDLQNVFPQEYQDSFKVFYGSFYLHSNKYDLGSEMTFNQFIDKSTNISKYFLLVGREINEKGEESIWTEFRIPDSSLGYFECFTDLQKKYLASLIHNNFTIENLNKIESFKSVLSSTADYLIEIEECCIQNRGEQSCSSCDLENEEVINFLDDFFEDDVYSIYEDKSNKRLYHEILNEFIESGDCSIENLKNIIFGKELLRFKNFEPVCPIHACMIHQLVDPNSKGGPLIFEILKDFRGTNFLDQHLIIRALDFRNYGFLKDNAYAAVLPDYFLEVADSNKKNICMVFNTYTCWNTNPIVALETIQHELIHVDIYKRLINEFGYVPYSDSTLNQISIDSAFSMLKLEVYNDTTSIDQHDIMIKYHLFDMMKNLQIINNGVGYHEFEGLILFGMGEEALDRCGYTEHYRILKTDEYNAFVKSGLFKNIVLENCQE